MSYFYKDKTRQAVKQTQGQKLVYELGRKLQTAKNERQKKFEIRADAVCEQEHQKRADKDHACLLERKSKERKVADALKM